MLVTDYLIHNLRRTVYLHPSVQQMDAPIDWSVLVPLTS